MLTWQMVLERTRRFISDVKVDGRSPRIVDLELVDFWETAQDDLVQYVARPSTFTILAGTSAGLLPDDLARIDSVSINDGTDHWYVLHEDVSEVQDVNVLEGLYWYLTHDKLSFTQELDYAAVVRYKAYYPPPAADGLIAPCLLPKWAVAAGIYNVSAQALEKQSIADPQLRQWASKTQDSGTPVNNPFLQVAKYMLERYRQCVYGYTQDVENQRLSWRSSYR